MKQLLFLLLTANALKVWRGVRYAEPVKRWQAPEPYRQGFKHAIVNLKENYGDCPKNAADQSYDCLFLDIFKPDNADNLPIYIWDALVKVWPMNSGRH